MGGEELDVVYKITVAPGGAKTITFPSDPTNKPVRVIVESSGVNISEHLFITVSQDSRVVLVQLPTIIEKIAYTRAERTLCPPCPGQERKYHSLAITFCRQ